MRKKKQSIGNASVEVLQSEVTYCVLRSMNLSILFERRRNCHGNIRKLLYCLSLKRNIKLTAICSNWYKVSSSTFLSSYCRPVACSLREKCLLPFSPEFLSSLLLSKIVKLKITYSQFKLLFHMGLKRGSHIDGRLQAKAAFLKLFSSGEHFHQSECFTDHPTLGIIRLIRPALNSVRNMFLQQKIPLLLLRVEQVGQ